MLSFVTEIPIDPRHDSGKFLTTIAKWITGSPHTNFTQNDLLALFAFKESVKEKSTEKLESIRAISGEEERAGIRYTRHDKDLEWITTVSFSRDAAEAWIGIRITCESLHPAVRLPPAKKPVLVRTLLKDLGGSKDGPLVVSSKPVHLKNTDIELAAKLIRGNSGCRLPIVYVSAGFAKNYTVDLEELSETLAGMAHVIVEPNRPFSLRLKNEVDSENVYGGAIGVYWPDGGGRRSFFLGQDFESKKEVAQAVFHEIRTALTNRRALDKCTWAGLVEAASRHAMQTLRESGSQEIEKYIETFDKELNAKAQQLQSAENEIARLKAELRAYEARLPSRTGALLKSGTEEDLYRDETLNIVHDALEDAVTRVPADSRRQHVLHAILASNPKSDDIATRMREQLKSLLRGTKSIDGKLKRSLEEMGFSLSEEGKHYKLIFQDDDRYTFTLSKSGSDHRGGLNAASDIARLLF